MKNTCQHCGTEYHRPPSLIGRFCSQACARAARRKDAPIHRRIRYAPDHPLAGKTGLVSEARALLFEKLGPGPHPCHWCGTLVNWVVGKRGNAADSLIADHINNDPLDDSLENLAASCGRCNGTRTQKIKPGEPFIVNPNGTRVRAVVTNCEYCGEPFLVIPSQFNSGKGRFCSRSCARRKH